MKAGCDLNVLPCNTAINQDSLNIRAELVILRNNICPYTKSRATTSFKGNSEI